MHRAPRVLLALAMAAVFALSLSAQRNKDKKEDPNIRTVEGVVLGLDQKPAPRAIVQLKDMRTLQVRSFITQAEGAYNFSGLNTAIDYELQATLGDLQSDVKRLSTFDTRKTPTIVLQLEKK